MGEEIPYFVGKLMISIDGSPELWWVQMLSRPHENRLPARGRIVRVEATSEGER